MTAMVLPTIMVLLSVKTYDKTYYIKGEFFMTKEKRLQTMVITALLCALGIAIPMFAPKVIIGPMSFTLASHVPIFIAMFISPAAAAAVTLVTTAGFFAAGFPLVIVLRALSHIVFVMIGAFWLKKRAQSLQTVKGAAALGAVLSVVHAGCEVLVVTYFFFGNLLSKGFYSNGYVLSVLMLVGIGGFVHSMVDYSLSIAVWKPLVRTVRIPVSVKNILSAGAKSSGAA